MTVVDQRARDAALTAIARGELSIASYFAFVAGFKAGVEDALIVLEALEERT